MMIKLDYLQPLHPGFELTVLNVGVGACWCLRCNSMVWVQVWLWTCFFCMSRLSFFLCLLFLCFVKLRPSVTENGSKTPLNHHLTNTHTHTQTIECKGHNITRH